MRKRICIFLLSITVYIIGFIGWYYFFFYKKHITMSVFLSILSIFSFCIAIFVLFFYVPKEGQLPQGTPSTNTNYYDNIIQLIIHADNLNWQRLYYFLIFNSILSLAWVNIFSLNIASSEKLLQPSLLSGISLIGFIVSILWIPVAIRGIEFQNYYMGWARYIERNQNTQNEEVGIFTMQVNFTEGEKVNFPCDKGLLDNYRDIQIKRFSQIFGARKMIVGILWIFILGYFFLFVFSLNRLFSYLVTLL